MSNLSDLLPSGGGSKSAEFVASGTLPNGQAVILNSNGTVTAVAGSGSAESIPSGSSATFSSGTIYRAAVSFDPNTANKFVIAFTDGPNSGYGTAIIGTISGSSITFGSKYVFLTAEVNALFIAYDPNTANKFVVVYRNGSNQGGSKVGTVSGTAISYSSEYIFNSSNSGEPCISFDPNTSGKFVIAYMDNTAARGKALIGTLSGTSISYGSDAIFNVGGTEIINVAYDPSTANKFVIVYKDSGNASKGTAIAGSVSGTSITYGSEYVFNTATTNQPKMSFDPNTAGKFVVAYYDGASSYGSSIVGTVSGTAISYGSSYVFNSAQTNRMSIAYDPNNNGKFAIAFRDAPSTYYLSAIVGTVSGTAITYGSKSTVNTGNSNYPSIAFDSNSSGKFVIGSQTSGTGQAVTGQISTLVTNLTTTNFVGIPDKAYAASATATVVAKGGVSLNQTSLTIGTTYYVQGDGTLGTSAGTPSVEAGRAISATSLLLKGI